MPSSSHLKTAGLLGDKTQGQHRGQNTGLSEMPRFCSSVSVFLKQFPSFQGQSGPSLPIFRDLSPSSRI